MTLHFLFLYIFIVLLQFPVIWERYKTLISVELNLPFKLHNMEFYRELLKMVKPSQQKKMSGLDYFSTEGGEAFDEIIGMVDKLSNVLNNHEEIKNDLNMIKKFYKFDYASKISKIILAFTIVQHMRYQILLILSYVKFVIISIT